MKIKISLLVLLFACFTSCSKQESFTHSITATEGLSDAKIAYVDATGENSVHPLAEGDIVLQRAVGQYQIGVQDATGTTYFNDVPEKYINLDAKVEFTRNVFQDYFPEEWAPLKGTNYTTLYIKSKKDNQVFYIKVVKTGTDVEIGKHSESF